MPNTLTNSGSDGFFTKPSGWKISPSVTNVKMIFTMAGNATHKPTVETSRTVGDAWVSFLNRSQLRNNPNSGATMRIAIGAATAIGSSGPCSYSWSQ